MLENDSRMKVDRVLANHSLSSTASQGTTNIPFPSLSLRLGQEEEGKDLKVLDVQDRKDVNVKAVTSCVLICRWCSFYAGE